jgi:hypothetical protein
LLAELRAGVRIVELDRAAVGLRTGRRVRADVLCSRSRGTIAR